MLQVLYKYQVIQHTYTTKVIEYIGGCCGYLYVYTHIPKHIQTKLRLSNVLGLFPAAQDDKSSVQNLSGTG